MIKKNTLYLGLNDKDRKIQVIDTVEAVKMVSNILAKSVGGGTIFSARGIYTHENGDIVIEETLRIEVFGAEDSEIIDLVEVLKKIFNQEAIVVETAMVNSVFM